MKFFGLWEGIDPSDGGFQLWSIARHGEDGADAQVRLSDTYIRACNGDRATILGFGALNDQGDLEAPMTIQCLNDPDNSPKGDPIEVTFNFTRVADGNLEVTTLPINLLQQPTTLHKISDK